jgi:hypothetical protein
VGFKEVKRGEVLVQLRICTHAIINILTGVAILYISEYLFRKRRKTIMKISF